MPNAVEAFVTRYANINHGHLGGLSRCGVAPGKRYFSSPPSDEPIFLDMVKLNFEMAAAHTDLTPGMVKQIMACNSVLRISFPIERVRFTIRFTQGRMENGSFLRKPNQT